MENRAKKARRLLDVLEQLHQIEEQKKLALQRRFSELERSQQELIGALNARTRCMGCSSTRPPDS